MTDMILIVVPEGIDIVIWRDKTDQVGQRRELST